MRTNVVEFRKAQKIYELPDDLMPIAEFAQKYKCAKSYLYKLHNQNKIKFYPIGRFKVSASEVLRAMGV